uniref:Uncharacterized protein n=1 Tax=Rhizophora mucronata TaxID=61149 RepID=A0A2P2QY31_RHIMU
MTFNMSCFKCLRDGFVPITRSRVLVLSASSSYR